MYNNNFSVVAITAPRISANNHEAMKCYAYPIYNLEIRDRSSAHVRHTCVLDIGNVPCNFARWHCVTPPDVLQYVEYPNRTDLHSQSFLRYYFDFYNDMYVHRTACFGVLRWRNYLTITFTNVWRTLLERWWKCYTMARLGTWRIDSAKWAATWLPFVRETFATRNWTMLSVGNHCRKEIWQRHAGSVHLRT